VKTGATSVAFVVSKTHHTLAKIHNIIGKLIGKQIKQRAN